MDINHRGHHPLTDDPHRGHRCLPQPQKGHGGQCTVAIDITRPRVEDQNSFFLQQTRVQDHDRDQHLLPRLGPPHHLPHDPLTVQQTDNLHVGLSN